MAWETPSKMAVVAFKRRGDVHAMGSIIEDHYNEMIRIAKLNHYDQPSLWGTNKNIAEFNEKHKEELTSDWDKNTKFILGPYWELN
jgi:hypothetical protein